MSPVRVLPTKGMRFLFPPVVTTVYTCVSVFARWDVAQKCVSVFVQHVHLHKCTCCAIVIATLWNGCVYNGNE